VTDLTTAWMLGCVCGFFIGVTVAGRRQPTCRELMRDPDWRRSFSHENTNAPQGPPPLKFRRSGDAGSLRPTTSKTPIKPAPSGGLMRDAYGCPVGYTLRPQGGTPNPPPSDP